MSAALGMIRPPVGFGPGSQPDGEEEGLAYLPMPSGMRTYESHLPDVADPAAAAAGLELLRRLHGALSGWAEGTEARLPLDGLTAADLALIDDTLGEGEVSVLVERPGDRLEIQEAVLAGVWRVRSITMAAGGETTTRDALLVGAFPRVALNRAFPGHAARSDAPLPDAPLPAGLMNGQPVLTELLDHAACWTRGAAAHAVNFSLLPHTSEDIAFIEDRLGKGGTTILSRGYGNCRVTSTATANVWWVRYYNSVDTLILDTVEVTDVPAVVCAAPEDIADSAERLGEILVAIGGAP